MKKNTYILVLLVALVLTVLSSIQGTFAFAAELDTSKYTPLTAIPGLTTGENAGMTLSQYLPNLFKLGIAFSAVLAILMIVLGGLQYMSTDAVSGKKDGKEKVKSALFGLALVMFSVLLLQTINPDILNIQFSSSSVGIPKNNNSGSNPNNNQNPKTTYDEFIVTISSKITSKVYKEDRSAISMQACEGKAKFWQKVTYTTVNPKAGRNGCYKDQYGSWCVDLFAGDETNGDLMYIKSDCTAQGNYSECEAKKRGWEGDTAFNAVCRAIYK